MKKLVFLVCGLVMACNSFSQETSLSPTRVVTATYFDVTPPLINMPMVQIPDDGTVKEREVPNKIRMREFKQLQSNGMPLAQDPVLQTDNTSYSPPVPAAPIQNFEGINNTYGVYPPDTQGDVGPNHYMQMVNLGFAIWNKTGTLLYGPANSSTIWQGIPSPWNGTNNGDPIVLYDQAADRWLATQFSLPNTTQYAMLLAVSQTNDPTGSWYRWVFEFGNKMPDYPKFGIWPDGYYLAVNQFISGSSWGGVGACAFERDQMILGNSGARMVYFNLGASADPGSMLPSDWDGATAPIAGEPNYFVYFNDWSSPSADYLKIWQFHVDWTNTANSTFSEAYSLTTASFDSDVCTSGNCCDQPGTTVKLETLSDRLMYRLQYRNFGTHRSMVTNHTVDANGSGLAGIRWYELRNSGLGWSIHQQSTYAPDANHRWMGSIAMNANGNMALGYSVSNASSIYPTIRYTGRLSGDPLGMMTFAEETIINGSGSQTGSSARWGDYSMMSVDPTDDATFWFTTEYIQTTGATTWRTRIASFQFGPVAPVAGFTVSTITPCIGKPANFTDQSTGSPTSWQWSFNPNTITYIDGTSATSQNPHVQFNAFGNYTVSLTATNAIGSDVETKTNFISVNAANPDFSASLTTVVINNSTIFTDATTCGGTSWSWNFGTGATPATASTIGPHTVSYSTTGLKTVSLTVNGSYTKTKTDYINVIPPEFNMSNSTITTCTGNFYDPGGSTGQYSNNQDFTMVFNPDPGNKLKFVFNSFNLEYQSSCSYDYLKIYNGQNVSAPLIGTYCGTTSPGTITADNATGSLTFVFHSDYSVIASGWSAAISCISTIPIVADFVADNVSPEVNSAVTFTDLSTGGPTTWNWSFNPTSVSYTGGTTSASQNPQVLFTSNGPYSVSLLASNSFWNDTETKTNYIHAGTPGLWTGVTSTVWNTASNWHNYLVPSSSNPITIPTSAPNFPITSGDMTIGTTHQNFTLSGNAVLTVNGDLAINPGYNLTATGNGLVRVSGNWTNYGLFNPGTSTVEFFTTTPARLVGGINPATYIQNLNRSTFTKGMTALSGATTGPTGDNGSATVNIGFNFNFMGTQYTQVLINTNGWIAFNINPPTYPQNNPYLFTADLPNATLAPWWDKKIDDATSIVSYKTEGSAPDRVFTTEWYRVLTYNSGSTSRISFQVKLFETTNVIEYHYGNLENATHSSSESASIGIEDLTGGANHFIDATTGSFTTGISNLVSTTQWPTINFRFTPPDIQETFYHLNIKKGLGNFTIERDIKAKRNIQVGD